MSVVSVAEARPDVGSQAMQEILARQREAFLKAGPPTLQERRADLRRLRRAIKNNAERIALEISGDFGNRSRYETLLADVWPTLAAIRHAIRHLPRWTAPKRVSVGLEFMHAHARILHQPVGVVGIISPWNYPFQLAIMTLIAALAAVDSIVSGKLLNAGQTCIAPDYVLVPRERREDFIKLAGEAVQKFYPMLAANPDYDSIVNERHYRRVVRYVAEAKERGVRVVEFNPAQEKLGADARKLAPTLVIEPGDELLVMREEIFGPVLPVKSYGRIEEAIEYVNRRPRPLALYYFGEDEKQRDEVLNKTLSGGVSVNDTLLHVLIEELPFGGIGASGIGAYHGEIGFQTFSHRKGVFLQSRFNGAKFLRPPFGRITALMLKLLMGR